MRRPLLVLSGAMLIVWLILPLVPMLIWSFARGWRFPDLLPQEWSLQAWDYALSDRSGVIERVDRLDSHQHHAADPQWCGKLFGYRDFVDVT
jgi:hypothetical protein